jgi:hypothetical protein
MGIARHVVELEVDVEVERVSRKTLVERKTGADVDMALLSCARMVGIGRVDRLGFPPGLVLEKEPRLWVTGAVDWVGGYSRRRAGTRERHRKQGKDTESEEDESGHSSCLAVVSHRSGGEDERSLDRSQPRALL